MNNSLKKGTLLLAAMGVAFHISPMNVMASSVSPIATSETGTVTSAGVETYAGMTGSIYKTSSGHNFSKEWQDSAYDGDAALVYGYNTVLINEDYAWASHSAKEHSAIVGNANGAFMSSKKAAGSVAKIEVRHSGSFIEYQNTFY